MTDTGRGDQSGTLPVHPPVADAAPTGAVRRPATPAPGDLAPPDRPVGGWVLICAMLCATLLTGGWLLADAVAPAGYSPIRQTVSVLAGHAGTHRWIVTTALVLVGASYLATSAGMTALRRPARAGLAVAGTAAIGVAMCP